MSLRQRAVQATGVGVLVLVIHACGGLGSTSTPRQSIGKHHDNSVCGQNGDANWVNWHGYANVYEPVGCSFTVWGTGSVVPFSVEIEIDSAAAGTVPDALVQVWDLGYCCGSAGGSSGWQFLAGTVPAADGKWRGDLSLTAHPAGVYHTIDLSFEDSVAVTLQGLRGSGTAKGYGLRFGHISTVAPSWVGPSSATISGYTWGVSTEWDSDAYMYKWLIDGVEQASTSEQLTTGFPALGSYTLTGIATRVDGVADTLTRTITVPLTVAIAGPSNFDPYTSQEWTAAVGDGGTPPYTYAWAIDGAGAGTSSGTSTSGFVPSSSHSVQVQVWDANGFTASWTLFVETNSGTCDPYCEQPSFGGVKARPKGKGGSSAQPTLNALPLSKPGTQRSPVKTALPPPR